MFIKKYPFSLLTIALIWYLCFFTPPSTKLDHVVGIDKVAHFGMYLFLGSVILWEQYKVVLKGKDIKIKGFNILGALILPILMSGLIEILQETCTGGRRSGDIYDFLANSIGALASWFIMRKLISKFYNLTQISQNSQK